MRLRNLVATVLVTAVLSIGGGLVAVLNTNTAPVLQRFDGVLMVKTMDAGWKEYRAGDYSTDILGNLTAEYGWKVGTLPSLMPNTSGNCETYAACVAGK